MSYTLVDAVFESAPRKYSAGKRLVLVALANHTNVDTGLCCPGMKRLAEKTGLAERQVYRIIRDLKRDGIIIVVSGGGRSKNNHYQLRLETLTLNPDIRTETLTSAPLNPDICAPETVTLTPLNPDIGVHAIRKEPEVTGNRTGNRTGRMQKPSLAEVTAYCDEHKFTISPQRFIDHYDSNGWRVGRNPMHDWKAAVRTWVGREKENNNGKRSQGKLDDIDARIRRSAERVANSND